MLNNEEIPLPTHPLFQNLTGLEFGRLTVLSYAGQSKGERSLWTCKCICGTIKIITGRHLKKSTQSCGCLTKEVNSARCKITSVKHGMSKSITYISWQLMKNRCTNPAAPFYERYGGRGIKVCNRWLDKENGFTNFYEDMGERRSKAYSIDRIDNDGNYEPENCRWATRTEQTRNRRNTRRLMFNGKEHSVQQLAEILNLTTTSIYFRLYSGWTLEQILSTPFGKRKSKA